LSLSGYGELVRAAVSARHGSTYLLDLGLKRVVAVKRL
jgi:hypothetical protein